MRRADLITAGLAVIIHVGIGVTVSRAGKAPATPRRPKPVELQFEKREEPPPAPVAAPAPLPPAAHQPVVRKVAMRTRAVTPARAAAPAAPSLAPAAAAPSPAPAPMYAVAMTSTTAMAQAVGVPGGRTGGTGTGRPGSSGTAASGGPGDGFKAVSAREVGSLPEVDADACGRAAVYPREAEQSGIEGDVRLRVMLNERGQVHGVRVLSGLGGGLDAAAVDAIRNRCKFKPAIGRDGQPVAFVIESYKFHFELPR